MSLAAVMGELQNAYRTSQALVSGTAANLSAAEGSTRVDPVVQNNGLSGTSVIQVRAVDLLKFEGTLSTSSEAGTSGAVFKYNDQLNSLLLNPQKESFISKALVNFTNAFNITKGTVAANARSQIVAAAQTFTNQVTSYATGLQATKANLETDISNTIGNINSVVAKLSQVNQSLGSTSGNNKALDQRDSLLTLLSSYVSVQCQFGNNGIVTVRTTNGNDLVTDTSSYAQISYTQDLNLLSPNPASSTITIQTISASTSAPITTTTVSVDNVISGFGGQLAGFFTARNTTLPAALANINNATQQVMSQIDDLHNLGSGFPPAGSFTSNNTMYTTDLAAFTGTVNFAVTDANGDPVLDVNGRTVKPVTVDFDKLVSSSAAAPGQFTVQDVINEINQVAAGYSKASIGLGAVAIVPGAAQQYLIDQVRLVPTSNVAAGGQMSIDVELNSGSQFGTSFQVIGVQVFNAAGVAVVGQPALTATAFNLAAGQQSKTGQNIVVNLNAPDVQNLIRLEMRVIGADGTFETKYADFVVSGAGGGALGGAGSQIMNQRVEAIPSATAAAPLNVALGGGQVAANATAAKLGASLVSASFVDSNGLIVNTAGTAGYLKVSSVVGGGGIIIDPSTSEALPTNATRTTQSENFSHWFGLNNFFTADPVNPATNIAVNPTLVANPSQIAIGKAQALTSQINTMVPQTLPTALLNLTGNQPANGDSVTISGVQFNFWNGVGVAPANPVTVAATIPATLQNLYTVLKSYVGFTNTLTFAQPAAGANTMTIIAQSANANVAVTSVINGVGNLWQYADGLGNTTTSLVTGTAAAVYDLTAGVPNPGDTITVNGQVFTFGVGAGQVAIGTAAQTIVNLQAAMNLAAQTNPLLSGLLTFTVNPANAGQLIISAAIAGSPGNKLTIAIAGAGALQGPDAATALPGATLIGGVDIAQVTSVDTYGLKIGVDSNTNMANIATNQFTFVNGSSTNTQTLTGFFGTSFVNAMITMYDASQLQQQIDTDTYNTFQQLFDLETKNSKDNDSSLYIQVQDFINHMNLVVKTQSIILEANKFMIQVF